jgi:hypothetical protein
MGQNWNTCCIQALMNAFIRIVTNFEKKLTPNCWANVSEVVLRYMTVVRAVYRVVNFN